MSVEYIVNVFGMLYIYTVLMLAAFSRLGCRFRLQPLPPIHLFNAKTKNVHSNLIIIKKINTVHYTNFLVILLDHYYFYLSFFSVENKREIPTCVNCCYLCHVPVGAYFGRLCHPSVRRVLETTNGFNI